MLFDFIEIFLKFESLGEFMELFGVKCGDFFLRILRVLRGFFEKVFRNIIFFVIEKYV